MMQSPDLTFKHNLDKGRHGWIRLTPAYSIKLVENVIKELPELQDQYILDPFSGTGTTGLVSAQHGIASDLYEINPFLVWVSRVKTRRYASTDIDSARKTVAMIVKEAVEYQERDLWFPSIRNIERWWNPLVLNALARIHNGINLKAAQNTDSVMDLLKVAFCRLLIFWSNAAFNHQSMSFKKEQNSPLFNYSMLHETLNSFGSFTEHVLQGALDNPVADVKVFQHNSKKKPPDMERRYSCVITSPPYANRISYVREVRPYMYWLGFIKDARQAAELEWDATGGTWGAATSRLSTWKPQGLLKDEKDFLQMIDKIRLKSTLLANYVHRYFEDMYAHFSNLRGVLSEHAEVHYIIGNSKFYDVMVPTEEFYVRILEKTGFKNATTVKLRKRSSKKELFEYEVSADWKQA